MIKKSCLKIICLSLIVGLNWAGLSAVIGTIAYLNDTENSTENTFSAGTLDISLDSAGIYVSGLMYPTDTTATSIGLLNNGSLAIQYISTIIPLTANTDPCNYVNLNATDGTQSYSGPLLNFISATTTLASSANWNYTFTIDSSAPPSVWNKTCYFKWVFTAWDKDIVEPIGGFFDVEEKSGGIRIGKAIVLNEILANPTGPDDALKPGGEWVELYNNSNINFDVNGWAVYDSDDSHELYITTGNTNTGSTIVPAHGFLVVYRNHDADFTINNDVETIRLYTGYPVSSSVLVDSYSWTTEKPEGFSFARIPDGVGAWVDPIPTPGGTNVLNGEIEETLMETGETPAEEVEIIEATEEPVVEVEIFTPGLTGEIFVETTIIEEVTEIVVEEVVEETPVETAIEEVSAEPIEEITPEVIPEIIPEVVPEEPAVIEEPPAVVEEQPAIEEQPVVVEEIKEIVPEPASVPEPESESQPELVPENNNENSE